MKSTADRSQSRQAGGRDVERNQTHPASDPLTTLQPAMRLFLGPDLFLRSELDELRIIILDGVLA